MDANEAIKRILAAESSTYTWEDFGLEVTAILAAYRLDNPM